MKRLLIACLFLSACSGLDNIEFPEVASTFSAASAAATTAVITTNPIAIAGVGLAAGVATSAVTPPAQSQLSAEQITEIQNPWQAFAVAFQGLMNHAFEIVIAIGIATIAIPMLISYLMGRFKQRPEDAKTITKLVEKIGKMKDE